MALQCGIIGLPNVGKSTLFNALTSAKAAIANYPFTTIDSNKGVVEVPDWRLQRLVEMYRPRPMVPATVQFVDIAGLVEGASRGEGLGNRFLGHIREVDAIVHVIRCFEDPDVVHLAGTLDPLKDMGVIQTELALADLETLRNRIERIDKRVKAHDVKAVKELDLAHRIRDLLNTGKNLRRLNLSAEEGEQVEDYYLLTRKPVLYAVNVGESDIQGEADLVKKVEQRAMEEGSGVIVICAKIEAELLALSPSERTEYLEQLGIQEAGLSRLVRAAYQLLGLLSFFTIGDTEVRAWTIRHRTKASVAAGKIHSDMERGFIRAEVMSYEDLFSLGSAHAVREKGLLRQEGRDYQIRDGDIVYFRFHV